MEFHNDNIESEIGYAFEHLVYKRFLGLEPFNKMIEYGVPKLVTGSMMIVEFVGIQVNIINVRNELFISLRQLETNQVIFKFKIFLKQDLKGFIPFDVNFIKENQIKYCILVDNDRNKLKEILKTIDEYEL
jgi:hypothetical protein